MLDDRSGALATQAPSYVPSPPATFRLPSNLVSIPVVKQETNFSCGAAATLSMLRLWLWSDFRGVRETDLHEALQTTEAQGTEPEPIEAYLRSCGLQAHYRHGNVTLAELRAAVDRGEPPILDLQAWRDRDRPWRDTWDAGHYVVLAGYDGERLFVMNPSILTPAGCAFFPIDELEERWHDLAGPHDVPVARMAIFVSGPGPRWQAADPVGPATRLR